MIKQEQNDCVLTEACWVIIINPGQTGPVSSSFSHTHGHEARAHWERSSERLLSHIHSPPSFKPVGLPPPLPAILAIIQEQVRGLDQSQRGDERWSKWLDPIVNVLFAFFSTIGQVLSPASVIFTGIGILLSVCTVFNYLHAGLL
jgi:hypothetical protein